ncbi:prenyltransferase/squalene oxidase repeat-containing protein [Enterococcus xiangfangensis]|uniref:DUF4430 domain-containing protein n=1 Tax=Enterococcus xiangfangensis TaxID=1296537 RepID=A0ABU3F9J0_9ENTE|nr:DUF4430 domain-containing protein [Enterococcus xiangfangensis]MDT2759346.1 DUF4430 domain-containing protein [Enterococcus xiangfangensis]
MKKTVKLLAILMMMSPLILNAGLTVSAESSSVQTEAVPTSQVTNLNDQIAQIRLESLTVADQEKVEQLIQNYNQLTNEEKIQVKSSEVLQQASQKIQGLLQKSVAEEITSENLTEEKTITLSVERFTIGEGYVVEPMQIHVSTKMNYATLLDNVFRANGMTYQHTGTLDSQFYLSGIDNADNGAPVVPEIVKKIAVESNSSLKNNEDTNLAEFDYSQTAGWMYSVNNVFSGVGMSDKLPADGDVFRIQYSVIGLGTDLETSSAVDKTALTKKIAEINRDKNSWQAQGSNYQSAYQNAMKELEDLTATQLQIDQALTDLVNPMNESGAATEISEQINKLPAKEQLKLTDKDLVLKVKSAFDSLPTNEQVKISGSLQKKLQEAVAYIDRLGQADNERIAFEEQLNKLPEPDSLGFMSMKKVPALRKAYDALSLEAKQLVSAKAVAKLEGLEARVIQLNKEQANDFANYITTLREKAKVIDSSQLQSIQLYAQNCRLTYDQLTDAQKQYVNQADIDYLVEVEAKISEMLSQQDPLLPIKEVEKKITNLPDINQLKLSDESAVSMVQDLFNKLSVEQQDQVSKDLLNKLNTVVDRIKKLKDQASVQAVIDKINTLPAYEQLTEKDFTDIKSVEAAFDALDSKQQALVTNKAILDQAKQKMDEFSLEKIYQTALNSGTERIISQNKNKALSEWDALALAHSGYSVSDEQRQISYDNLAKKISTKKDQYGKTASWTDAERQAIGVLSLGGNLTDINGYNVLADLSNNNLSGTINNQIYGLIVLSAKKPAEKNQKNQIDLLIKQLLDQQLTDGGWALFGNTGDIDITGMTLTALAPYKGQEKVSIAIEKAIAYFKKIENQDGNFFVSTYYAKEANSNSQAQAILGLASVGEDLTGAVYKKKDGNPIDALIDFQLSNGGFEWLKNEDYENGMATQQAVQALSQVLMQKNNRGLIYDFEKNPVPALVDPVIKQIEKQIIELPAVKDLTLTDKAAVVQVEQAYKKLAKDKQEKIDQQLQASLKEAIAKIAELEKNQAIIQAVEKQITALPAVTNLTLNEKSLVSAVESNFYQLSATLQKQVDGNLQKKLQQAVEKIKELENVKPEQTVESLLKETQNYMLPILNPKKTVIGYGSEWSILGLARNGYNGFNSKNPLYLTYYGNLIKAISASKGVLDQRKYTEYSRVILAVTALGKDAENIEVGSKNYNLFAPLSDFNQTTFQGINGADFALIAVDSNSRYQFPKNQPTKNQTSREKLIEFILDKELKNGGWNLSGTQPDVDLTAMTLQALAPYYKKQPKVKSAVNRGLTTLSHLQNKDGSFSASVSGSNGATLESSAQVLVALSALGIDGDKDPRFIKQHSVFDSLVDYHIAGSGFMHILPGKSSNGGALPGKVDGIATEQAMNALVAYKRFLRDENRLYDMTDAYSENDALISAQVTDQIRILGTITLSKKNQVAAALAAYEGLTKNQKQLIASSDLKTLKAAEVTIQKLTGNKKAVGTIKEGKTTYKDPISKLSEQHVGPVISSSNGGINNTQSGEDTAGMYPDMSYISEVPVSNAKKNHSTIKADNIPIAKKQKKTTKNKKDWDFAGDSYTPNDDSSKAGGHSSNADKGHGHTNVATISEIVASILVIAGGIFWYVKKFHVGGQSK